MDAFDPAEIEKAMGAFMRKVGDQQAARNIAGLENRKDPQSVMTSRTSELHPMPFPVDSTIRSVEQPQESSGGGGLSGGSFCGTFEDGGNTYLNGGAVLCGADNFNVAPFEVDTSTDGEWLVQIKLDGVECATDDDGEIFIPGVVVGASGTPSWDLKDYTPGTNYDSNTNPTSPSSPNGDIVVPNGKLIINGGVVRFIAPHCGNIHIGQCGGVLNHSRA